MAFGTTYSKNPTSNFIIRLSIAFAIYLHKHLMIYVKKKMQRNELPFTMKHCAFAI
jgi:hypothetical protein